MNTNARINRVPRSRLILYSFGNFGWMMTSFCMTVVINYFYFPPTVDGVAPIPELISRAPVFLGLTIIGIVLAVSRCFDAITDPIIANFSDRSTNRFGRRRIFMIISVVPFALTSLFVFIPPDETPTLLNALWVGGCSILAYLFLTMYVVPYTALIPELGKTNADRIFIATANSVAWALAFGVGQLIWVMKDYFESTGMEPIMAIRTCALIFATLGVLAMLVPIIAIDENKYCDGNTCSEKIFSSIKSAFKNTDFKYFTIANSFTFMATFFLETGVIYYITMLLGMSEASASLIMISMFVSSFALYPFIVKLTKRYQKRTMQMFALALQGLLIALIPLSSLAQAQTVSLVIVMLIAIPTAINSILPVAMLADIAKADGNRTGSYKEGVFFGAMNFSIKMAMTATTLVFPSIIILGSVDGSPTKFGVSMTAVFGAFLSFAACYFLYKYNETRVNADLREEPNTPDKTTAETSEVEVV